MLVALLSTFALITAELSRAEEENVGVRIAVSPRHSILSAYMFGLPSSKSTRRQESNSAASEAVDSYVQPEGHPLG